MCPQPLQLTGHHGEISAMTFGKGSRPVLLCSASADYIIVWDLELCQRRTQEGKKIALHAMHCSKKKKVSPLLLKLNGRGHHCTHATCCILLSVIIFFTSLPPSEILPDQSLMSALLMNLLIDSLMCLQVKSQLEELSELYLVKSSTCPSVSLMNEWLHAQEQLYMFLAQRYNVDAYLLNI